MFKSRDLVIATKHGKESVITPILEKELGVKCFVPKILDTDTLGTFTGEIDRKADPISTARIKCNMAMEITNCDLAIASEGSFGAHPGIFFVPADDEFVVFVDKRNNLEIIAREVSTETNFSGSVINNIEDLLAFATKVNFPSHGLILRNSKDEFIGITKGITNVEILKKKFQDLIYEFGTAYVETDMRALYNPTRMKIIERATKKLAKKINSLCPNCKTPGFGITDAKNGLPCEICNFPTRSTLSYVYTCLMCGYAKEEIHPNGKKTEDPMYCDMCNP